MIRAFLFDLGGVVVDNLFNIIQSELSSRFGVPCEMVKVVRKRYWPDYELGRIGAHDFWNSVFADLGIALDVDSFIRHTLSLLRVRDDTLRLIKELKADYRLVLVTNNCDEWSDYCRDVLGLGGYFDAWLCSSALHIRKPDEQIYLMAAESAGVEPHECVFVDDKQRNIDGAEKVGMKGFLFRDADELRSALNSLV